ncbi:hypothetical protein KEM55_000519 [Ascosphaera atra]|nr:hypothetical protein KEM55_000519 [Ascosphaera atra]
MPTIIVPEGYGNVIVVALGAIPVLSFLHGALVTQLRHQAKVVYPNYYATPEQAKENKLAEQFNAAQRAHGNFLENMPQTMISTLIAGLKYPTGATVVGLLWVIARIMFLHGYVYSGLPMGKGRFRGSWFWLAQFALGGMALYGVAWPIVKAPGA